MNILVQNLFFEKNYIFGVGELPENLSEIRPQSKDPKEAIGTKHRIEKPLCTETIHHQSLNSSLSNHPYGGLRMQYIGFNHFVR